MAWVIEVTPTGADVLHDSRICWYDLDDVEEALRYIQRHRDYRPGEDIFVEEMDGYRSPVRL